MANVNEKILTTAKNNLDALGNALGKKVGAAIKSDAKNATNLNAKDLFTTTGTMKIPEAVYNAVAKAISDNVPKSIYTKYSENEGELIKQVSTQVGKLLSSIDEFPVSVKEGGKTVKYTVKFNGSKLGVNGGFISVRRANKLHGLIGKTRARARLPWLNTAFHYIILAKKPRMQRHCWQVF